VVLSEETVSRAIVDAWSAEQIGAAIELLAANEGKFPSGIRKLPRELVRALQRERMIVAMFHAASELGYGDTRVQDVIDRAGVTRPAFYEHFANKEDCFLLAFDQGADRLLNDLQRAVGEAGEDWSERLQAAIEELLRFVAHEPHTGRVLIVESRAAGPAALARRAVLLEGLVVCIAALLDKEQPSPRALQASVGLVGAIETLLYSRLSEDKLGELKLLVPSLMYLATLNHERQAVGGEKSAVG
jgi:AcrR family transcriptional regulator